MKNETLFEQHLDCTSCSNFTGDGCVYKNSTKMNVYHPCHEPSAFIMQDALRELLSIRLNHPNARAGIGAAILIDMYSGATYEMLQQKYSDVYGDVGHECSGCSQPVRCALNALTVNESSCALMKWYENYKREQKAESTGVATKASAAKSHERAILIETDNRTAIYGGTEFFVLKTAEKKTLITPMRPEVKTAWGMRDNRFCFSEVKKLLDGYLATHEYLKPVAASEPSLMTLEQFTEFKDILPDWEGPSWLNAVIDGTTMFVMAAEGKKTFPMGCMTKNVWFRPVLWVKKET